MGLFFYIHEGCSTCQGLTLTIAGFVVEAPDTHTHTHTLSQSHVQGRIPSLRFLLVWQDHDILS